MPQNTSQTEPYYELHRNFADRYRCRVARRLGVPAKTLAAYYATMHDLGSNAGTFGEFTTDVRAFEEAVGEPERFGTSAEDVTRDMELASLWRKLAKAKVCELIGDPEPEPGAEGLPSEFRVRVLGMASRPRKQAKSRAEVQKDYRDRKRDGDTLNDSPDSLPNVTNQGNARSSEVTLRGASPSSPSLPSLLITEKVSVSLPAMEEGYPLARPEGLTVQNRFEISDETEYAIDRLVGALRNADDGTRGVLVHLARMGADHTDFDDARQAVAACTPLNPAGYAVTTITNRLNKSGLVSA